MDKIITINNDFKKKINDIWYKVIVFIVTIIITVIIAKIVKSRIVNTIVEKNDNENRNKILYTVLGSLFYYFIIFVGLVIALNQLGYQLSSILIVLGSVGLAIALAIQNTIVQVVSGFLILFFGYFNIGDLIMCNGATGFVSNFNLLGTTLKDPAGIMIILPNSSFTSSTFTNYTINKDIVVKVNFTLSANNNINFDILINNIKNSIINNSKYLTNKDGVVAGIDDNTLEIGTKIFVKFPIKSKDYLPAGADARMIVRKLLVDDNVKVVDYYYGSFNSSNNS
jgi:small conductance mechanosensitive channel